MSESAIRAKIKTIVGGVTDIGVVLDSGGNFPASFKATIASVSQFRAWEIGRRSATAKYESSGEEESTYSYVIRGYLHIPGGTDVEKTFNTLIEGVRAAFRFNFQLDGLCEFAGPVEIKTIETRDMFDVPFQYCELSLPVSEWAV